VIILSSTCCYNQAAKEAFTPVLKTISSQLYKKIRKDGKLPHGLTPKEIVSYLNPSPKKFKKWQKWFQYKIPLTTQHVQKKISTNRPLKKKDHYGICVQHILGLQRKATGQMHGWHWDPNAYFFNDLFELESGSFCAGLEDCYMLGYRLKGSCSSFKKSSFFPVKKTAEQVMTMLIQAYNNPTYSIESNNHLIVVGRSAENISIKICIDTTTNEIKTAYPLVEFAIEHHDE
jgi:hypothetical protein